MFTGIIEELGVIKTIKHGSNYVTLNIRAEKVLEDTRVGDSIATNGVCLTVTELKKDSFHVDMIYETLNRSNMKHLKIGSIVNLERALTLNSRLGGHMVSGHVDGVGTIENIVKEDHAWTIKIKAESQVLRYIIEKGSVALDGISLTVTQVTTQNFSVSIIPHTQGQTTLHHKKVGDTINIECDLIGKYVEKLIKYQDKNPLTEAYLHQLGY